ncbi:unnamed protein product [Echinostoma caproni]|uniref:SH2 domain-containing protein n=1 Tax=Echinostoma caproni TaxID=27848 RepID=A0A183AF71_9TREM|nr:unnamed protein product [Echinostoma caproni]
MQVWNTADYVSKKFALRECPIVLAQLLNTTRVRFALLQTNCYLDVQTRVLNWRHRATPWTKGAIVEVAGPNYSSIDHCNALIDAIVPFYATRRPYVEISPPERRRIRSRKAAYKKEKIYRALSSVPVPNRCETGPIPDCLRDDSYLTNPYYFMQNYDTPQNATEPDDDGDDYQQQQQQQQLYLSRSNHPPKEPRKPRAQTLPGRIQTEPVRLGYISQKTSENEFVNNKSSGDPELRPNSILEPGGDEIASTGEQNKHNATGLVETNFIPTLEQPTTINRKRSGPERNSTYPRPKLFESERSARLAIHSQKAAAVRASLQKMKEDKMKRIPVVTIHKTSHPLPAKTVSRVAKSCFPRAMTPKELGDHAIRRPGYDSSKLHEKCSRDLSPDHRGQPSWDRCGRNAQRSQPGYTAVKGQSNLLMPETDTYVQSPLTRNLLDKSPSEIVQLFTDNGTQQKQLQGTRTEINSTEIQITSPGQPTEQMGTGPVPTGNPCPDHTEREQTKGPVVTSDAPEFSYAAGSLLDPNVSFPTEMNVDTATEDPLNGIQRSFQPSGSQLTTTMHQGLIFPNVQTASSSRSSHILLSATPAFFNEHEYVEPGITMPNAAGECQLDCTNYVSMNIAQAVSKALTDMAEYRLKSGGQIRKESVNPEPSMISEFSALEPRMNSLHVPVCALTRSHSVNEPQSLINENTEVTPNHLLSTVLNTVGCRNSRIVTGTSIKTMDESYVKQMNQPLIPSPCVNVRPRLFERIDFCSQETTDSQDILESATLDKPTEIDLGQLPRRSEVRTEEPRSGPARTWNKQMKQNTPLAPPKIVNTSVFASKALSEKRTGNMDSKSNLRRTNDPRQGYSAAFRNQKQNPRGRKINQTNSTSLTRALAHTGVSNRSGFRNARPPVSPGHSPRIKKDIEIVSQGHSNEVSDRSRSLNKLMVSQTTNSTDRPLKWTSPISVPHSENTGSRSIVDSVTERNLEFVEPNSPDERERQHPKLLPQSSPVERRTGDNHVPDSSPIRPISKAMEYSIGESTALTPCYLPRPSPNYMWLSKNRDPKIEVIENFVDFGLISLKEMAEPGELPLINRSLVPSVPGTSVEPSPSAASTDLFIGLHSPSGNRHSVGTSHAVSSTSKTTTETESTDSLTQSTSGSSGSSSSDPSSNDGTPFPFPEHRSRNGQLNTAGMAKFTTEIGHPKHISECTLQKPSLPQYQSRDSYRVQSIKKRKPRHCSSVETRAMCESYSACKTRCRSRSVYNFILRCLPLQWCFGSG